MEIQIVLYLLFLHWVADFVMQDVKWAERKSYDIHSLLRHVIAYSIVMYIGFIPISIVYIGGGAGNILASVAMFMGISFYAHLLTDFFTSRIVKRKFEAKQYGTSIPNVGAFTVIGLDQFLHFVQILLTAWWILGWM